jgi:arylsulfatase A-like enzyme
MKNLMTRLHRSLAGTLVMILFCGSACRSDSRDARPNILIIVTDDQGYADLSAYSHHAGDVQTPNMDRLAQNGVLFTQAYVTAPVCSPSRAGWNTGRYQQRWDPKTSWNPGLPDSVKTLAEYLQTAGYVTGKVGKSDFGTHYHRQDVREYPLQHGFTEFLGFSSHAHDYFLLSEAIEKRTPDPYGNSAALGTLFENQTRTSYVSGYTTEIFTDWAIGFLKQHQKAPFFLTVSYNAVHHLIHEVPKPYLEKYGVAAIPEYQPETMGDYRDYYNTYNQLGPISDADMRKYYLASLNCLDDNIGRLLDALEELHLAQNTLVIFFSDNGGSPLTGANNRPLRGSKYILFEGGVRVPFMMQWPGQLRAGSTYPYVVSTLDILPSCLAAAGLPIPKPIDGASVLASVTQDKPAARESEPMFWTFQEQYAVRDGDWKLVKSRDQIDRQPTSQIMSGPLTHSEPALYNLRNDPAEQINMIDQHRDVAARLQALYGAWQTEMAKSQRQYRSD